MRRYLSKAEHALPIALQRPMIRLFRDTPYSIEFDAIRSIFVHIPKTAGTSIGEAIYGRWVGHVPLSRFAAFDGAKFNSFFKFSFVRNPWDRVLSAFAHLKGAGEPLARREKSWSDRHLADIETFEQFILKLRDDRFRSLILGDAHFRPQLDWITMPGSGRIGVDYLGRFESLDEDYSQIAHRLGVASSLPIRKQTKRPRYRDAYSGEMSKIVEEILRNDIEILGYSF